MPLPGTSATASASSSTVILVSVLRNAVISVISTLVLLVESIAAPVVVWSVPPFFTVISALSTVPMASLKVRTTFVRSPEAFALDSVGLTPSTLWLAEAARPEWSVFTCCPRGPRICFPSKNRESLPTSTPSLSSRLSYTVRVHTRSFVGAVPTSQPGFNSSVPMLIEMNGSAPVPLTVMFLSNVNVTTMSSPMM